MDKRKIKTLKLIAYQMKYKGEEFIYYFMNKYSNVASVSELTIMFDLKNDHGLLLSAVNMDEIREFIQQMRFNAFNLCNTEQIQLVRLRFMRLDMEGGHANGLVFDFKNKLVVHYEMNDLEVQFLNIVSNIVEAINLALPAHCKMTYNYISSQTNLHKKIIESLYLDSKNSGICAIISAYLMLKHIQFRDVENFIYQMREIVNSSYIAGVQEDIYSTIFEENSDYWLQIFKNQYNFQLQ